MLIALTGKGELFNLALKGNIDVLRNIRERERFFCPQCGESLILKLGMLRIPHFAHLHRSNCPHSSEPESELHLKGKLDLYHWLKKMGAQPSLEHYFSEIHQRADLLIRKNHQLFAIEYQCSVIPASEITKRTNGYRSIKVVPIWLLGGYPYQKRISASKHSSIYHMSEFMFSFSRINNTKTGLCLLSYHPNQQQFYHLTNILPLSGKKVMGGLLSWKLDAMTFPFMFPRRTLKVEMDAERWMLEQTGWLQKKMYYAKNLNDPFLFSAYQNKMNPLLLSPVIGLPVPFMGIVKSRPVEWQFFIWIDGLNNAGEGGTISFEWIYKQFKQRILKKHIQVREMPFVSQENIKAVIKQYLDVLVNLGYLSVKKKGILKVDKKAALSKNTEEALRRRKEIMAKFPVYK